MLSTPSRPMNGDAMNTTTEQRLATALRATIATLEAIAKQPRGIDPDQVQGHANIARRTLAEYDAQHDAPTFDRFDVCEAYYCLESDYNVGGMLRERPSNMRRRESCGVQLHRMNFRARPDLETDTLTPNGRAIYDAAVRRLGLPA